MNLCLACRDIGPEVRGGLARATCDLAEALADEGHVVHLLTNLEASPPRGLRGVAIKRLRLAAGPGRLAGAQPESAAHNILHAAAVYAEVRRIHEDEQPITAVLAPLWRSEGALCLLDRRFPTIVSCMTSLRTLSEVDGSYQFVPDIAERLALEREALIRSPYLHGLTDAALDKTVRDYELRPELTAVIGRGLRDRRACTVQAPRDGDVEVLFVGRIERRKGVDALFAAARELARDGAGVHFTLVGPLADPSLRGLFDELAALEPRLRDVVTFAGAVSDEELARQYETSDIVCAPSRYESHGIVLIEAMMFGKPILTCDAGGIGEVVEPGVNALVAPPDDAGELARSLRRLAEDPELRARLGAAGRATFERRFAARGVARDTLSFVEEVAAVHRHAENNVERPLAMLLRATLAVSADDAETMARDLLDPSTRTLRRLGDVAARTPASRTRAPSSVPRVTAVVLTRDRARLLRRALDSLRLSDAPVQTIVIDNGSSEWAAAQVNEACARRLDTQLHRSSRNLGCAGGRRLGTELAESELVLFLDDDAELLPGALDHLVAELDAHPDAGAVSATVILPEGIVQHSGGSLERCDGIATFRLIAAGARFDPQEVPPSSTVDWVPGTAMLARRELLHEFPIDDRMAAYYEDNEWCYRVARARSGAFRRCRDALALHRLVLKHPGSTPLERRSFAVTYLDACARFYARHHVLLAPAVFDLLPELRADDGTPDVAGVRLLMELLSAKGPEWTLAAWMAGDFDSILTIRQARAELGRAYDEIDHLRQTIASQQDAIASQQDAIAALTRRHEILCLVENSGWWQLRGRILPVLRVATRVRAFTSAPASQVTRPVAHAPAEPSTD